MSEPTESLDHIAVIGLACRFPGATDAEELWRNLRDGVESISFFADEDLAAAGVPEETRRSPHYVPANGVLEGADLFDAEFFGFTPREAELMDPQHRLFLEHAWQACENAGYNPQVYPGRIGVYGGSSTNGYFLSNLLSNPELLGAAGSLQARLSSDKDFLSTQVSYKLNLRGPSFTVQSACSTSLVAIHLACQALLDGDCDMALAGGVSVGFPQREGYTWQEGGISSPDGHCRAFDADAKGTVGGNGVGVVMLKRLADALADGDPVHAVILGTAVNNDGSLKAGFTAPSVESQAEVVVDALSMARVDAESIGMVEAHGSGTPLGDPIEVESLTRAFEASIDGRGRRGFCALGSVKTNFGHCDAAAGIAGLLKAVLSVQHGQIPPSLHFQKPNPNIDLDASPFYVNTELRDWPADATPRRASVNSLGMGGTNAHVVVEEPPAREPSSESRPWQLLMLSARTAPALETATANLAGWLSARPELGPAELADVAHTLRVGRKAFRHRRALVCKDREEALALLSSADPARVLTYDAGDVEAEERSVAFLFPGLGDQYPGMGAELYRLEPAFRDAIDRCAELLRPLLGLDIREVLYPEGMDAPASPGRSEKPDLRRLLGAEPEPDDEASRRLRRTALAHPAVFAVEYALAQLWMEWGIRPSALIGYSLGEYVAACLAGVFSLEDALRLVAERARLVDALPAGAMLAVPLPAAELEPLLAADPELSLSADNGPGLSVAGGPPEAIERLEKSLAERGVVCRRLQTGHAFHSSMMEPVVAECGRLAAGMRLSAPEIPFVSNVTGTWISEQDATDPEYWARHLRRTVRFNQGIETLMATEGDEPARLLLEVGPGQSLVTLARQHPRRPAGLVAVASLRDRREGGSDQAFLLEALGRLWLGGAAPDWTGFASRETRHRVSLPTYPFDRRRFYVEPGRGEGMRTAASTSGGSGLQRKDLDQWFHAPVWERVPQTASSGAAGRWLLLLDTAGLGERLAAKLEENGAEVLRVAMAVDGGGFSARGERAWEMDPRRPDDYGALFQDLKAQGLIPDRIVHLWSFHSDLAAPSVAECEDLGFYSLLWLFQALGEVERPGQTRISVVANGLQEVTGGEELRPEKATLLGPCRVFPQESPDVACAVLDVIASETPEGITSLAGRLAAWLPALPSEPLVALRGRHLWARRFRPVQLPPAEIRPRLRQGGVYLIAGALRETGVVLAEHLFHAVGSRLALLVPRDAPPRAKWEEWLGAHDETEEEVRRMRRLLALEASGAELLVLPFELTRADRVKVAVDRVRERFGDLHGVIHAAGEDGAGLLQWKTREAAQSVLAPKVQGTLALAEAVKGQSLDFFLLFGSRAGVIGGFGQGDTCAAASFLDAFAQAAQSENGGSPIVQTVDWDFFRWHPVTATDPGLAEQLRRGLDTYGIAARELAEVFDRVLASPLPQVAVSVQDLEAQLGAWSGANLLEGITQAKPGTAHSRPDLATPYAEPESEIEKGVAAVWQEAFGIDRVGVHDNFFDLAGNSLLAVQIVSRLSTTFGIKLSITSLLESPTVAELSGRIGDELTASVAGLEEVDEAEMERLLREIEGLSAEEAQARLDGEANP